MVRKQDVSDRELFSGNHKPVRRRVVKRRHALGVCFLVAMTIFVVLLPRLLTARSVLLPIIDRYAGLTPLRVDFESFSAGWFSPVVINGLQLIDGQGNLVAKIGAIDTQKGVLSWVFSSQDLGTIRIRDVAVDIAVSNGTTSLESALEPMLSNIKPSSTEARSARMAGSIELSNAQIMLRDSSSPEAWLVAVPNLKTQLPEGAQVIGPTVLSATIAQAQGAATGSISAEVAEIAQDGVRTFNCLATLDHVPLAVWQVLHKRLPEVPLESLAGSISARISGSLVDGARWSMSVEQLTGDQLQVSAPQLIGAKPAKLDLLQVRGKAALASGRLQFEGTEVRTDFGGVAASGNLPWPVLLPTVTSPWLPNAQLSAEGNIDLARLVKVAESLVPMREDTRLTSGTATFRALQRIDANGQANSSLDLQLGDLVALAGGQQLTWDQPLKLAVQAEPQADGHVAFQGSCTAEFCQLMATGTADAGSFKGEVSLDKLQQRLAQWVQLPLKTMTGSADVDIQWNQPQPGLLATEGKLRTSPLIIEMASGGQLREPAWQGTFSAQSRLHANQISSIERGHLELVADSERLAVDLLEPLTLTQTTLAVQAPAAFTVSSEGALDLWQHRAVMLKLLDPGMTLAGKYSLGASGRVDLKHLELQQANWRSQPFEVGMGTTQIVEPEMVGNFQGRVDTADPTRLAVEKLVVQAHSFSLTAADAAATGVDKGRSGTGAFIVDLGQLMKNVRTNGDGTGQTQMLLPPGAGTPSNAPSDSQVALSGQVSGNMRWQVSSREATLDLDAKTGQMDVVRQTSSGKVERLWSEAQLLTTLQAAWDAATGNINVSSMQLQAPWMHYVGTLQVQNQSASQTIRANGQCLYDAGLVAAKLQPYLGNNIQLAGRKTVPVEVVLTTGGAPTTTSTLAGLQAATRVGWEQARVVGIEVGNADVPVVISAGQFSTQAEIPVSGGTVRFDVASDLTAPQTVIIQKPMTVLENVAITPQMCQGWLRFVAPLLSEVTSVDGRLSLQLNQARYNLVNPRDQIVDGQLIIHNAAIGPGPLSNQILGLAQQINAIRKRELGAPASNQQVWMQMPQQAIAFRMENGRVYHRDLKFHVGDVQLASSGSVDIDGQMEMNTSMPIPDDWIAKSPLLAGMKGQIMQFPIRGSLTSPQLDAQFLKDFGRQAITQAADGLIQQQLSRGLGKIFGQLPTPVGTPLQPNVTPETPPATTTAPRP